MGVWKEIVDYTVPSNTTSVILDNFGTITKDDFVKIVATFVNASNATNAIDLTANTSINSEYHTQSLGGDGSNVFAARENNARIDDPIISTTTYFQSFLKISENDRLNVFTNAKRRLDNNLRVRFNYFTSSGATFPNGITSLTFNSNQTNGIGAGSRIQIYKLTAKKVADILVTSNTTQVDITGLDIKKGDEYLLVSDALSVAGIRLGLGINNNVTPSNYWHQNIDGNGTSATAARANEPAISSFGANFNNISHTHIKLSNIGAYTYQSYSLLDVGQSSLRLRNLFGSSTAENISNINQLNIFGISGDNLIATGSRFQLYKLYEGGN